jgi:hypothetical protein
VVSSGRKKFGAVGSAELSMADSACWARQSHLRHTRQHDSVVSFGVHVVCARAAGVDANQEQRTRNEPACQAAWTSSHRVSNLILTFGLSIQIS